MSRFLSPGPSSGFAVLTQATGLLKNGNAIHQQLHMSEFVDSGKETAGDISLPPKDIANKYIEGGLFIMSRIISVSKLNSYCGLHSILCKQPISSISSPQFPKTRKSDVYGSPPCWEVFQGFMEHDPGVRQPLHCIAPDHAVGWNRGMEVFHCSTRHIARSSPRIKSECTASVTINSKPNVLLSYKKLGV